MLTGPKVELCWAGKQKNTDIGVEIEKVSTSIIHPNPLYQESSLFEPWGDKTEKPPAAPGQRIMQGDNLVAMHWLISAGYSGKIDMIYIDPPYLSQSNYQSRVLLTDHHQKEWLQREVFRDSGFPDLPAYLNHLYSRLVLMRELLSDQGSIFVHLDWHACHYVKIVMDEIFGTGNFINEIVWCYSGGSGSKRHFHRKHDVILWYSKGSDYTFHPQYRSYSKGTLQRGLTRVKGDRFHLHEEGALLQDWWIDINKILSPTAYENLKFPTQKPAALLRRLVESASDPGDLIADFYAGSGTLAQVAEESHRNWISSDNNSIAVKTMLYRLIEMKSRDFYLDVIGKDAGESSLPPSFDLYGPYIKDGGEDYRCLEIGIENYTPGSTARDKLKGSWAWPVLIDFWEIDTCANDECFHSCWQVIRPQHRQYDSKLPTRVRIPVAQQVTYRLAVKVHDIFGNEMVKCLTI